MDKFVVSLPRGGAPISTKRKQSSPSDPTTNSKPKQQRVQHQMYLDLGQKSFGANKLCETCNMLYVIGDEDDEKRHRMHCSKAKTGPTLASIKGLTELSRFNEDKDVIVEVKGNSKHKLPTHQQDAIDSLMSAVQDELGCEARFTQTSDCETVLLYLQGKSVLACLVTMPIHPSKLALMSDTITSTEVIVALSSSSSVDENISPPHTNSVEPENRPTSTTLGVKLIWTAAIARRQGLAGRLLDAARKCFEFGRVVKREHIGFSQPTTEGLALALSYCRRPTIWGFA